MQYGVVLVFEEIICRTHHTFRLYCFPQWIKLDANISNFPSSPYAIAFHVCVGSILYLYFTFWLNGNMFDTLKYLAVLSIPTLITGKRTLALVTAKRAAQSSSSK